MKKKVSKQINKRVVDYWSRRADSYADEKQRELHSEIGERWDKALVDALQAEDLTGMRILDVGCGTGILSMIMARHSCKVTGIDLTPSMIEQAKRLAAEEGLDITFEVMDAQAPTLPEGSFDYIISRNLTWTLPNVEKAYTAWYRLLKEGGKLINYDADYAAMARDFSPEDAEKLQKVLPEHVNMELLKELAEENKAITLSMNIAKEDRPRWDLMTLMRIGFRECGVDAAVGTRIYDDEHDPGRSIFMVTATR